LALDPKSNPGIHWTETGWAPQPVWAW
jgi:hypothetical protein